MRFFAVAALPLVAAQGAAWLDCTVSRATLTKRLCEFDSCPSAGTASVGEVLRAGCLADCSTPSEPWVKLFDGTYVQASNMTVSGCNRYCEPIPVARLPLCHKVLGLPTPTNCAAAFAPRRPRWQRPTKPTPLGPAPMAAQCSALLKRAAPHHVRSSNDTVTNSTASIVPRAHLHAKRQGTGTAVLPGPTAAAEAKPLVVARSWQNGTFSGGAAANKVGRAPPTVTKAPLV